MFCAKDAGDWRRRFTSGLSADEAQYRLCMARCLDDLFRKSDAIYGQRMPDGPHRQRVEQCAAGIGHVEKAAELLAIFAEYWMGNSEPPQAADIIAVKRFREKRLHGPELRLIRGGLHA